MDWMAVKARPHQRSRRVSCDYPVNLKHQVPASPWEPANRIRSKNGSITVSSRAPVRKPLTDDILVRPCVSSS